MENKFICKCCEGTGIQVRNDGIKIYCPSCKGTGESPKVNRNMNFCLNQNREVSDEPATEATQKRIEA